MRISRLSQLLWSAAVLVLVISPSTWASDQLEAHLNSEYSGKVLIQRHFLSGRKLAYSEDGKPIRRANSGPWTLDAEIRVDHIKLRDTSTLEITGQRLVLLATSTGFSDLFTDAAFTKDVPQREWNKLRGNEQVTISIVRPVGFDETSAHEAIAKIFLTPKEHLADFVPDYWKSDVRQIEGIPNPPYTPNAYHAGNGVSAPRAIEAPNPAYPDIARQIRYQGNVVLWAIVDATGSVEDVRIARALGIGLDEAAVAAVKTWRFRPAAKDGHPVAVQVNLNIDFRLQ